MNILFFIHCLIGGGAERVTVKLAEELINRGHNVTIGLTKEIIDYKLPERVKIEIYRKPLSYDGKNILMMKFYALCNHIIEYKKTRDIIRHCNPDIIIASWGSKTMPILRLHGNIPIIASEHNTFDREHTPQERKKRFILNSRFDKVVVLTNYDKEFTKNYLHNTIVIPNPLTFIPLTQDEYESSIPQRKNILACGRINAYHVKGFDNLIIAFSKVAKSYPGWDLDIAGAGNDESINKLKLLARDNNVESRVHFLGFCSDINDVMKRHSIFALTSRSEGFGMVITEAMAMGCTCVSYALTGPSEIIKDKEDGLLVENQNVDEFSKALEVLMEDDALRKKLGTQALTNVRRFSVDRITNKWEELFRVLKNE